jgi:hypothetical protein
MLTDNNARDVDDICRRLDGIPLATLPPPQILAYLHGFCDAAGASLHRLPSFSSENPLPELHTPSNPGLGWGCFLIGHLSFGY